MQEQCIHSEYSVFISNVQVLKNIAFLFFFKINSYIKKKNKLYN